MRDGYQNIHIVDNASTNPEMRDFLADAPCEVHYMQKNWGHHVLWDSGEFDDVILHQPYVLTDPDILPAADCPSDYVEHFYRALMQHPERRKVGFSLRLDDLPETYPYRFDVIRYELFYWEKKIQEPDGTCWYDAPIDTTFAVYRPGQITEAAFYDGLRSAAPYVAQHLGWYMDMASGDADVQAYIREGQQFSTSVNPAKIREFALATIGRLMETRRVSVWELLRSVGTTDYLRSTFRWSDFLRGNAYLTVKWLYAHPFFDELRQVRAEKGRLRQQAGRAESWALLYDIWEAGKQKWLKYRKANISSPTAGG